MSKRKATEISSHKEHKEQPSKIIKSFPDLSLLSHISPFFEINQEENGETIRKIETYVVLINELLSSFKKKEELVRSFDKPNPVPTRETLFSFSEGLDEIMYTMTALMRYQSKMDQYTRKITKKVVERKLSLHPFEFNEIQVGPKTCHVMLLSGLETNINVFYNSFHYNTSTYQDYRKKFYELLRSDYSSDDLSLIGKWLGAWRVCLYSLQNYMEYSYFYVKQVDEFIESYCV